MSNYTQKRQDFIDAVEILLFSADNDALLLVKPDTLELDLSETERDGWDSYPIKDFCDYESLLEFVDGYVFDD